MHLPPPQIQWNVFFPGIRTSLNMTNFYVKMHTVYSAVSATPILQSYTSQKALRKNYLYKQVATHVAFRQVFLISIRSNLDTV